MPGLELELGTVSSPNSSNYFNDMQKDAEAARKMPVPVPVPVINKPVKKTFGTLTQEQHDAMRARLLKNGGRKTYKTRRSNYKHKYSRNKKSTYRRKKKRTVRR